MLGLYIHIPFCNQVCPYCDFYKMVASNKLKKEVINALLEEMKLKNLDNYTFDTVYIGGGTPSSLDLELLELLLFELSKYINLKNLKEFTIEVNPTDITLNLINLLIKYHISRVSIGVQTFNSVLQKIIKREFSYDDLQEKILLLRENGINNINLDLMYSIPGNVNQLESTKNDLKLAISLNPTHLSIYSLILEEHTIFDYLYKKGKLQLVSEDTEASLYEIICKTLKENNFIHYETSNFAINGYQSLHNLIYWNCNEYIAIGPSASSYLNNHRFTTTNNLKDYLKSISDGKIILLEDNYIDEKEQIKEEIILGLRKTKGISKDNFYKKYKLNIKDIFYKIDDLIDQGLLEEDDNFLFIPEKHFYISNYIINKILK